MSNSADKSIYSQAMHRANSAIAQGRFEIALTAIELALRERRDSVDALNLKGALLARFGRTEDAILCFDRALAIAPEAIECLYNKASLLQSAGRHREALDAFDRALALKPDFPEALNNRGLALNALEAFDEAVASFDRALALRARFPQALNNRGIAFAAARRFEEAIASYSAAIAEAPNYAEAYANRAVAHSETAEIERALADFSRATALAPNNATFKWNQAISMLLAGDFERGLTAFEWRPEGSLGSAARPSLPYWRGEPLANTTILLRAEQGLGDTIQFCRYAPLLAARGPRVILDVQPQLKSLLANLQGVSGVIARGESPPPYDCVCPLLSLPLLFRTRIENIPARTPYLAAQSSRVDAWRDRLATKDCQLNVGIAWAGKPGRIDSGRSIPLRHFAALSLIPGVRLISLQKEVGIDQLGELAGGMCVETLGAFDGPGEAFLDTAAVMHSLDLIIASDSAIAHLAGALARPVWLALKLAPDWRWLLKRDDSPWYPTMRLFRQQRLDDWTDVFALIARELERARARKFAGASS
jgi:Flp pilus assembly protein TadD